MAILNPKIGTVVTIPRPKVLNKQANETAEQPKAFQFSVTWDTLLAFPQPVEISEPAPTRHSRRGDATRRRGARACAASGGTSSAAAAR